MSRSPKLLPLAGWVLLAGCQGALPALPAAPVGDAVPVVVPQFQVTGAAPSTLELSLVAAGGYGLQDLPTNWPQATVVVFDPAVSGGFSATNNTRTLTFDGAKVQPPGATTVLDGSSKTLRAVTLDTAGNMYVVDQTGSLQSYDAQGAPRSLTTPISGLSSVGGVALDTGGNIYIAASGAGKILKFSSSGAVLPALVTGLTSPDGLAIDAGGNLYVAEHGGNGDIKVFDDTGALQQTLATGANYPRGVALDGLGNLYYTEAPPNGGGTLQHVASVTATTHGTTTMLAAPVTGWNSPAYVTTDGLNNVYVADASAQAGAVYRYTALGALDEALPLPGVFDCVVPPGSEDFFAVTQGNVAGVGLLAVTGKPRYHDTPAFPPLRPAAGYSVQVYLTGVDGGLLGSGALSGLTLSSGANALSLDIQANAGLLNVPSMLAIGGVYLLQTGFGIAQPGVARVVATLAGNAYPGATATIATLTDPATWDQCSFATGATSQGFDASKLVAGTATLTFSAFDVYNQRIGVASAAVTVH